MLNRPKKGFYLNLHSHMMHQLRKAAKRHHRTVATEATCILEETLRPGHVWENAAEHAATEKFNANGLSLELSEELMAPLRLLAERNYRSVAGEAAFVLETALSLTDGVLIPSPLEKGHGGKGESDMTTASRPKLKTKSKKRPTPRTPSNHSDHPSQ